MVTNITGKKILLLSPAFFNYENMIAAKMREMGAEVDMYNVRSVTGAFQRALLKISPNFFKRKTFNYYNKIIEENINRDYDYILIIKCDMTPISILKKFRKIYPHAKMCLYLWDSIDNSPGIVNKFKYFDTLHSFDLDDCKKHKQLKFRPLFYGDQFRNENQRNKYKYDICFLGTVHSDRYAVIKQVKYIANENHLNCFWFLYLQSNFIYWFYKFSKKAFKKTNKSMFSFNKLTADDIAKIVAESRIVLDIQHPKQTGLTMRTIEMIGMNKKIITTNNGIINYDFYNPNNICIIDRNNVEIDMDFFKTSFQKIDNEIYDNYSLKTWIKIVLS